MGKAIRTFVMVTAFAALPVAAAHAHDDHAAGAHAIGTIEGASPALAAFLEHVSAAAMMQAAEVVDCTLSGGTETKCAKLVLTQAPAHVPGPWCPKTITDGPESGGFWVKDGKAYDVDGEFVKNLAEFYNDPNWQMYDPETGDVLVTRSFDACFGAARPDVWREYHHYCAQCTPDQLVLAPNFTFFIPLQPVRAAAPSPLRDQPGAGVALNGVRFAGGVPLNDITDAYTIAPLDKCGGHVNPFEGYHYHFVTDCVETVETGTEHAQQIGISLDGYGIYERLDANGNEPKDLDECRGHSSPELGYHYHANPVGPNAIIDCMKGELGCAGSPGTQVCNATIPPPARATQNPLLPQIEDPGLRGHEEERRKGNVAPG